MRNRSTWIVVLITLLAVRVLPAAATSEAADTAGAPAPATPAAEAARTPLAADELRKSMLQAYLHTSSYLAAKKVTLKSEGGPQNQQHEFAFNAAFDRPGKRLAVRSSQIDMVAADGHVRIKLPNIDRYLDQLATDPLSEAALTKAWPMFSLMVGMPDLSTLTEGPGYNFLAHTEVTRLEPEEGDAQARPRLRLIDEGGAVVTYFVQPKTYLVTRATVVHTGQGPAGPVTSTVTYDIDIRKHNQPLDQDVFTLDTGQSQAVRSFEELVGLGRQSEHPLEGKAAPRIMLPTLEGKEFDLAKEPAKVVVLDFWATWCGPCIRAMPQIQSVRDWAQQQKLSVAFYAVNLRESADQIKAFLQEHGITLPVLLDQKGDTAREYGVRGIPQTVIISQGKVAKVHVGLIPGLADQLRDEILNQIAATDDTRPQSSPPPKPANPSLDPADKERNR